MSGIITKTARDMSLDEMRMLVSFCGWHRESYFDSMAAQDVLDVYHACGDWDGIDAALTEGKATPEGKAVRAVFDRVRRREAETKRERPVKGGAR